ncbi:MAG: DUF2281 domain-containing protein [Pseudomonadota bacterium]
MGNASVSLNDIRKKLSRLPENKLDEVNDFVTFLLSRHEGGEKKNIRMKGIWAGKGFEKMDIEKEVRNRRKEISKSISKRSV